MKKLWKAFDVSLISVILSICLFTVMTFYHRNIGLIGLGVTAALFSFKIYYYNKKNSKLLSRVKIVSEQLDYENGKAFEALTVPCAVIEENGDIIWVNSSFKDDFYIDKKSTFKNIRELIKSESIDGLIKGCGFSLRVDNHYFSVYSNEIIVDSEKLYLLYFFNQTELKLIEKEFYATRPSVMLTVIDNAGEVYQSFKESDCTSIFSRAEQMIEEWASSYGGLCRKFSNARMLIFVEERGLEKMIEDKFTILEAIRDFTYDGKETDITLSVGVGKSDDIIKANNYARQALDMAQSRGGDQVAIKKETEYSFYGGVSAGFEKRSKARTRLIAKTMAEIISESETVLIMGHRFSDFDSFGSAVGLLSIAQHLSKKAYIVADTSSTLAGALISSYKAEKGEDCLISPSQVYDYITENTLLIITDTHKQDFTEVPELIDKVSKVMVIDHHRKSVGFIDNTVMFYHIPSSSSACEMVAELTEYIAPNSFIDKFTATALLSGIMLDTRNFILRAGVRTYEAAAYLRSRGASPVDCKKLFSNDMELFRQRNEIIDLAVPYKECAVSVTDKDYSSIRLVTSQAADEMLNIEGIKASFVIFANNFGANISARSYGEINVQLIMEKLGGGGHQTMSACQLRGVTVSEAEKMLKNAIDEYLRNI